MSTSGRAESTSLSLSQSNLLACGPSNSIEPSSSSWTCTLCTYVNQIKASRCVQCSTRRDAASPEICSDASYVQDQLNALSIRESSDSEANALNRASSLGSNSMSGSRSSLAAAGTRVSPVEPKSYPSQCKWRCSFCTYENWPKTIRCSMCGSSKDGNNETERIGANTLSSPDRDLDENCAGNFIISNANKRNTSHHRYALSSSETINSCDSIQDRRLRQIRRQADWQWLNACIGKETRRSRRNQLQID